eukprot:XP_019928900.1 PREDICTED: uncharacterized protein LOC105343303 [Crassostrea gigas]
MGFGDRREVLCLIQPVKCRVNGHTALYSDGGIIMNYPISCFDGWWLSMKNEDSFLKRLHPLKDLPKILDRRNKFARDEKTSDKTLGFIVFNNDDETNNYNSVVTRKNKHKVTYPDTTLARKALDRRLTAVRLGKEHQSTGEAISKFLELAGKYDIDCSNTITKDELTEVFKDETFTAGQKEILFGENATIEAAMKIMDKDSSGNIDFNEIVEYCSRKGYALANYGILGSEKQQINSLKDFTQAFFSTVSLNADQIGFSSKDLPRTVGVHTHYVNTADFSVETEDVKFIMEDYTTGLYHQQRIHFSQEGCGVRDIILLVEGGGGVASPSFACAAAPADILFLLDSSRSEGSTNFQTQKDFVSKFVNFLNIGPNDVQVTVGSFSTAAYSFFNLNTYHNKANLLHAISQIPYRPGGTNTFYALDMAEHYSFTPRHGDRSNAPNIVYVMTDGQSSSHSWTHNAAQHLKNSGVKVFVIGVGHVSIDELIDMATDHEHVFTVDSFSNLPSIQHLVEATYCDVLVGRVCIDKVDYCHEYSKTLCFQEDYIAWAQMNCPDYCGFCQIHTPSPTTMKQTTATQRITTPSPTTPSTTITQPPTTTTQPPPTTAKTTAPSTEEPTPSPISEGPCIDKLSNCAAYGESVCSSYRHWAIENCARFCLFCHDKATPLHVQTSTTKSTTTEKTTALPTTTQRTYDVCEDKVDKCSSYGPDICFKYTSWAAIQCPRFCLFCTPETTTTPPAATEISTTVTTPQSATRESASSTNSMSTNTPVIMVSGTQSVQGTSPKQIELSSTVNSQELTTNPHVIIIGRK